MLTTRAIGPRTRPLGAAPIAAPTAAPTAALIGAMVAAPTAAPIAALIGAMVASVPVGCTTTPEPVLRPVAIHHLVVVNLENPADVPAIIADSDALVPTIPSVTTMSSMRRAERLPCKGARRL